MITEAHHTSNGRRIKIATESYNASQWNKTKWYTLNEDALAELMGSAVVPNAVEPVVAEMAKSQGVAIGADVAIDGQQSAAIDGTPALTLPQVRYGLSLLLLEVFCTPGVDYICRQVRVN